MGLARIISSCVFGLWAFALVPPALTQSKLTWTPATLDRFLSAPTLLVPGTRMVISLPDPAQRAAVIQYLSGTK
jgi:cytochrome c